jgi:hypothetical protein
MAGSELKTALIWPAVWFVGAGLFYFVVIPIGIEVPTYSTQSPALFPKVLAVLIGVLATVQFVMEWRRFQIPNVEKISPLFFVTPGVAGGYALLLDPIGFPLATGCALALLLIIFGERRLRIILSVSSITAVGIHAVFVYLLHIPLPAGILG